MRFEQYGEVVAAALSHADRKQPAHWYRRLQLWIATPTVVK
ncbi:hypothetical protein [Xanthomonas oryzae]